MCDTTSCLQKCSSLAKLKKKLKNLKKNYYCDLLVFSGEQLNKFLLSKTEELGIISREHPLDDKLTCSHYLKHNNILESQGEFTCKSPLRARLKIRKVRKHVS